MILWLLACNSEKIDETAHEVVGVDSALDGIDTAEVQVEVSAEPAIEPAVEPATEPATEPSVEPIVFELTVTVDLFEGALRLQTNQPILTLDCQQLAWDGLNCSDVDLDGLTDAWEDLAIQYLRPILLLDEAEPYLSDMTGHFAQILRVTREMDSIDVYSVLAWSRDYGRCFVSSHNGDSERVVIRLQFDAETNAAWYSQAYTAAHEGELTDAGQIWSDVSLLTYVTEPTTGYPRWVVYPSEAKHATFGSIDDCENVSFIPCLDEDCAPDNVSSMDLWQDGWYLDGPFVNVGEKNQQRMNELSAVGYPGEYAWEDQDFCGSLARTTCSSSIREKLSTIPF